MKILLVAHGLPPHERGGTELYVQSLAEALAASGRDEVVVLAAEAEPRRPDGDLRTYWQGRVKVVRLNNAWRSGRSYLDSYAHGPLGAVARQVIAREAPQVAHLHHLTGLPSELVAALAERGVPVCFTLHDYFLLCPRGQLFDHRQAPCAGPDPKRCAVCVGVSAAAGPIAYSGAHAARRLALHLPGRVAALLDGVVSKAGRLPLWRDKAAAGTTQRLGHMRALGSQVTRFYAPSAYLRRKFVAWGFPQEKIMLWRLGYDPRLVAYPPPKKPSHRRLRLGFLGSFIPSKGPHLLLEAVKPLLPERAEVTLYGSLAPYHGDRSYGRQLAPLLCLPGVRSPGALLARDELGLAFSQMDALVVPSLWPENAPRVIGEAFLAQVPVVGAKVGGIPEIVHHEGNGLLFRSGDPAALRAAIERLCNERGLLAGLQAGIKAPRDIAEDAAALREQFSQMLQRSKTPRVRRKLTAVVVNYKTPERTAEAARSLLDSARPPDSLLIVDNSAQERVAPELGALESHATLLRSPHNLGFAGGCNLGLRSALAEGAELLLLLNSDAVLEPECLELLEQALERDPRAGLAGPALLQASCPERIESLGLSWCHGTARLRQRHWGALYREVGTRSAEPVVALSGCALLVRREVLAAAGLFDPAYFFYFEDVDLCLRAARIGFSCLCVPQARCLHHGSLSIGRAAPLRHYYATRNHLRLARLWDAGMPRRVRDATVLAYNLVHATWASSTPPVRALRAVWRGWRDHLAKKQGPMAHLHGDLAR